MLPGALNRPGDFGRTRWKEKSPGEGKRKKKRKNVGRYERERRKHE
jgi:hypothetical protein